ncbi:MAG: hypothetical protein ACRDHP_17180, partial [Ktedonobacterales bacterium]
MGASEPPQPTSTETDESFVAEVSDLRDTERRPLRRGAFLWSARPLAGKQLTARQRLRRSLSASLAVALALLAIVISVRGLPDFRLFQAPPPSPTALRVSGADMSFLQDMAWSPDSRQIALLGCLKPPAQPGPCQDTNSFLPNYFPNALLIYDAPSGAVAARIHPDRAVLANLHSLDPADVPAPPLTGADGQASTLQGIQLLYSQVVWSPDAIRLALPFQATVTSSGTTYHVWYGIVLVDRYGASAEALIDPTSANTSYGSAPTMWNLATGMLEPLQPASGTSGTSAPSAFPAALAYRWDASDHLVPQTPLLPSVVPPAPPLAPVGNPDGGTS